MSVLVVIEARIKPECLTEMTAYTAERVPEARDFPGCQHVDVYFDTQDPCRMWTVGTWDSIEDNKKYMSWRRETGISGEIGDRLDGDFVIRYFDKLEC